MGNIRHFDDAFVVPVQAAAEQAGKSVNYRAVQIEGRGVHFLARAQGLAAMVIHPRRREYFAQGFRRASEPDRAGYK
jgi:hypothetical protein